MVKPPYFRPFAATPPACRLLTDRLLCCHHWQVVVLPIVVILLDEAIITNHLLLDYYITTGSPSWGRFSCFVGVSIDQQSAVWQNGSLSRGSRASSDEEEEGGLHDMTICAGIREPPHCRTDSSSACCIVRQGLLLLLFAGVSFV